MTLAPHATGHFPSGDVTLFYRLFGEPGETPILIQHGANYFDSYDWIEVAAGLATDRQVLAMDMRGFGETTWSPSRDYSMDARMDDIRAGMAHLGWEQVIPMVHSMSGRIGILFAANFPDAATKLIIVDSAAGREQPPAFNDAKEPLVFASVEAAMDHFKKLSNPPRVSWDRTRAVAALKKTDAGLQLKRDPYFNNSQPVGDGARAPRLNQRDTWEELARIRCPIMIVRGTRSDRYTPEHLQRYHREFPHIIMRETDSQHDVAGQAPDELIAHAGAFIRDG